MISDSEVVAHESEDEKKKGDERIARAVPIAKKVLKLITDNLDSIVLGDNAAVSLSMQPITEKLLAIFLEEDISWVDRHLIIQLALQPLSFLQEGMVNATDISWNRALTQLWGKESLDLKFSDVHQVLTSITPEVKE